MPPEKKTALVAAVEILARRLVSTAELRTKLGAKKLFSPAEIDGAVLAVKRMGALHDDFLAEDVARSYRSRGYGPARIRIALRKRGIPNEIIEQVLNGKEEEDAPAEFEISSASNQSDDGDNAFAVLHRKAAQFRREPDAHKRKAKAVRCLVGRGFSYEDAIGAADRWMREEGGGSDEE
ncbi:MAG: regulatory protein RecX [Lentisphaeria bacterium]|jgi:regulatory protein|nr:regulatory protein RecX [Lentisphaeria bacterium]